MIYYDYDLLTSPLVRCSPSCLGATFETTPTLNDSLTSANATLSASGSDDEEMREIARKINALSLGSEEEGSDGDADDEGREEEDEGETGEDEEDDDSATEKGVTPAWWNWIFRIYRNYVSFKSGFWPSVVLLYTFF